MYWRLCQHEDCHKVIDETNAYFPWCSWAHMWQDEFVEPRLFGEEDTDIRLIYADER